ncbi:MAG: gliding motility-associated C-terminal domain-containing protein [Marinoscillum sp.]
MKGFLLLISILFISLNTYSQNWNFSVNAVDETCFMSGDGSIDITMSGTTSGFTFTWEVFDDSDVSQGTGTVGANSPDIYQFLDPGDYTVVVSKNGTTEKRERETTVEGSSTALAVTKSVTQQNLCNGDAAGQVQGTATGGAGSYQYGLAFGTGQTSPNYTGGYSDNGGSFTGLGAGTYKVFAQDERGCVASTVEFALTAPNAISVQYDTINANCNNVGGQIVLTSISGGTPFASGTAGAFNYEQQWYEGDAVDDDAELTAFENKATLSGLDSGEYTVVITDASGCTGSQSFQIFSGFNLEQNGLINVSCATYQDGEITVRLDTDSQNDEDPFKMRIYDGADPNSDPEITSKKKTSLAVGNHTFSGLGPGTYTIVAEGITGCEREIEVTLTEPNAPQVDDSEMTPVVCRGDSDGSILLDVSGGSGSYRASSDGGTTYPWNSDGNNQINITNLAAGTYDLWIQDESNCPIDVANVAVTQPAKQWALSQVDRADVTCNGNADGQYAFEFDTSLDTDPVVEDNNIIWRDVDSNEVIATGVFEKDDLEEGSYRIEVTANSGCYRELTFDVSEPAVLEILGSAPVFDCPLTLSSDDAEINATVTGGNGGYTYVWTKDGGALTTETATNGLLEEITENAEYTLKITDSKGCTKTRTFTVEIPEEIAISAISTTNVACRGEATGALDIDVTGGTPQSDGTYIYYWEKDGSGTQYSNSEDLTDLTAGTYAVTVTDDNSCTAAVKSFTITQPATSYTLSGIVSPVICNGENNGEIDITINRGSGTLHPEPTSIEWTKDGVAFKSNVKDLTDLEPGIYVLTTNDKFGCEKSISFDVEEYSELLINPITTQNTCDGYADGAIEIDPVGGYIGGNAGYTIRWFKDGAVQGLKNDELEYDNLVDGTYRVVVSDSVGCTKETTIFIDAPDAVSAVNVITNIKCKGNQNGGIALDVSSGTEPYNILWKLGSSTGASISTNDTITGLAPGDYYVSIEDANDCTPIFESTYTVTEPSTEYSISIDPTEISCVDENDGSLHVDIDAEPGHPTTYTVKWYRNDVLFNTQSNKAISAISAVSTLDSAQYKVVVTDANGCERSATYDLIDPDQVYFNPVLTAVTCNGDENGAIVLNPTGGYGSFTATWVGQKSGSYATTNLNLSNLPGDRYDITLMDAGGCSIDTTIFLDNPLPIVIARSVINTSCTGGDDGAIEIAVNNGTSPYTFRWLLNDQLFSTEQNISSLSANTYQIVVSDQTLCSTDTIEVVVSDPSSDFIIEGVIDKITCRDALDGAIDVTVAISGEPDLDYDVYWEKNGTLFSQNTEDLTGIGHGTYEIFVEDQYGCLKSEEFFVQNPDTLNVTYEIIDVSCFGETDGSIAVQVSGGYGSYQYKWLKNGLDFPVTASFATGLEAAFYKITVTDSEGCAFIRTVEVEQPDPFVIEVASRDNTCATPYDSELNATVTGGVIPYKFQWFKNGLPFSKEEDLTSIAAGTYYMMATDTNFCETVSEEIVITTPVRLGLDVINFEDNLCPNTANGSISFQGTGGSFPYTYSFDSAAFGTVNNFFNLEDRGYLISVKDNVGCTFDTLIAIMNEYELEAEFSLETDEFAIDFPITLTDRSLGDSIVQWFWDFGDTKVMEDQNTSVTYTAPGKYAITLTVENVVGCRLSKTDTVQIIQGYNFTIPTAFTPNNDGMNESFRPSFQNIESLDMRVQDRNGVIVYRSEKLSALWDGTFNGSDAPQGVYYYEMIFTARSGKVRKQTGKIFLMR